jgi:membrane-associated phospholipid phosphatase
MLPFLELLAASPRALATAVRRSLAQRWAALAIFVPCVAAAFVEKRPLEAMFFHRPQSAHGLAEFASLVGDGYTVVALGLTMLFVGYAASWRAFIDTSIVLAVAGVWCFLLTQLGCLVLAEARPVGGGAMHLFALRGHGVSGHAAAAGLLFAPLRFVTARDLRHRDRAAISAIMGAWAILVAWSRMWLGMHYLWNVVLGLTLGLFVGRAIVSAWQTSGLRSCAANAMPASGMRSAG